MIINNNHNVQTSLTNSKEFGFSVNSSHIFSMLSSYLYRDKERSVITELCSNALDAHRMVGKADEPIHVHLPTVFTNEFRVRDFGPGLSEDDVYQFLTKYGSSSKNNSNDFIGGFGIGSKSPAAVTDSWTINSHHDGKMSSYLVHVNSNGIPSINKLMTKDTDETGLEVIIPTQDRYEWINASKKVFKRYPVKPNFKGVVLDIHTPELIYDFEGLFHLYNEKTYSHHAIVNYRDYSIDLKSVNVENWFDRHIHLPFDTCDLSVSLSREDLQYDSKTKQKLKDRFDQIYDRLSELWKNEVSQSSDIFSYKIDVMNFKKKYFLTSDACSLLADQNDDQFRTQMNFSMINRFDIRFTTSVEPRIRYFKNQRVNTLKLNSYAHNRVRIIHDKLSYVLRVDMEQKDDVIFVLDDTKETSSRLRNAIRTGKITSHDIILLEATEFKDISESFLKCKASDFEKPAVIASAESVKSRAVIQSEYYRLKGKHFQKINESDIDKNIQHVCIRFADSRTSSSINEDDLKFCREFKYGVSMIYVKNDTEIPSWASTPNDWVKNEYEKLKNDEEMIINSTRKSMLNNLCAYDCASQSFVHTLIKEKMYEQYADDKTAFGRVCSELKSIFDSTSCNHEHGQYNYLLKIKKFLGIENKELLFVDRDDVAPILTQTYELFGIFGYNINKDNIHHIIKYIETTGK